MNAVLKEAAAGRHSRDPRYACVLNLLIGNADGELNGGHAVLIAPDLALTAAHCVKQWQRRLRVRSALGGAAVDVAAVHWPGGSRYRYGDDVQQFPHFSLERFSDDIALLQLAEPLPAVCAALPFVPPDAPYAVELACADGRRGVRRTSSAVVTPGFTCGATTCSTSAARRPATRMRSMSSGVLMVILMGRDYPLLAADWASRLYSRGSKPARPASNRPRRASPANTHTRPSPVPGCLGPAGPGFETAAWWRPNPGAPKPPKRGRLPVVKGNTQ